MRWPIRASATTEYCPDGQRSDQGSHSVLRPKKTMKLGEMLKEAGLIDNFQLHSALSYQRKNGGRLGSWLITLKYVSEETLLDFIAEQLKLMRVDIGQRLIPEEVLAYLPEQKARDHNVIPVACKKAGDSVYLLVAMSDPTAPGLIDDLEKITGCRIRPALETESGIREAINHYYSDLDTEDEQSLAQALDEILQKGDSPSVRTSQAEDNGDARLQRLIELLARKGVLSREEVEQLR